MKGIDYILLVIFIILIGAIYIKEIVGYMKNRIKCKEYTNVGNSRTDKMWLVVFSILLILQFAVDQEIQNKAGWIGLSLLWIYRCSKTTILIETGIGQKNIFNMKERIIKWEQVESYKRTFIDEVEIEYKHKNDKIRKYNLHTSRKKIELLYEHLKKYVSEKEVE